MKKYIINILILMLAFIAHLPAQSSIKWEEIFDDPIHPEDWQIIDADGSGKGFSLVQTDQTTDGTVLVPQAGNYFWIGNVENSNLAGVIDEWLISPQISVIYEGDSLYFWAGSIGGPFDDSIKVKVSTTNNNRSSFEHELGYFKVDGPAGSWHRYGFDLSEFDSSDIYFAINYYVEDGGPGGANSDFVWIDHPIISGDPATFNIPPSAISLNLPLDDSNLDPESVAVDFEWTASLDLDDENLEYTLTILNVFPQMKFTGITDTVFSLNWQNILNKNTYYKWTVEVSDGKSYVAATDTFAFSLGEATDIAENYFEVPKVFELKQNYPNPFNPITNIEFSLPVGNNVEIKVYDALGNLMDILENRYMSAGVYSIHWDASRFASGVYFYKITSGDFVEIKKMVLLK